ncbi:virion structural protein [Erwinia phage Machina]|uniref:Putative virion structural protein n=2 Tax=Machinavirus machina TaxID=2169990 RepID=A0A1B2ID71_9CAUD|nr:virion structural protein [Erwinia phage vB_EamM_Huxley]YP_009617065.1 virion structural protein [Erwinia phage Machina]ANZ49230.1 putative virion structural protein [Erwinia phage vB_EamM_Huxley]ANZ49786.1 putative virion structural protein [Erwinia phage Machina]
MSFKSKQNLLKLINKENKISPELTFDDVDISLPEVVSVDGRDSKVTLTSKIRGDEGSQVEVTYHRRDLPDYILGDLRFDTIGVVTTHDYIPALNDRFDLNLLPEDLEDAPVAGDSHTVVAVPTSHEWRGSVTLQLVTAVPLASVVPLTELDGLLYPDHQTTTLGQASVYSYYLDASKLASWVPSLRAGTADMTAFAKALNTIVPELWVNELNAVPYNLSQAVVQFYGSPSMIAGTNPAFDSVLGLELGPLCTNFQGTLLLHFNN